MIIKFFHEGQTMLIDGVDFCKYRTLGADEQVVVREDVKDYTADRNRPIMCPPAKDYTADRNRPIMCPPAKDYTADRNRPIMCPPANVLAQQGESNARLEFWYERGGNSGQLLCQKPVFLMSDEGKTIERI